MHLSNSFFMSGLTIEFQAYQDIENNWDAVIM